MRYEKEAADALLNLFMVHQARNWWKTGWKVEMARNLIKLGLPSGFLGALPPMEPRWGPVGTMLKSYLLPPPGSNIAADQPVPPAGPDTGLLLLLRIISSLLHQHCLCGIQVDNNNLVGCEASRQAAKCVEIVGQHTNIPNIVSLNHLHWFPLRCVWRVLRFCPFMETSSLYSLWQIGFFKLFKSFTMTLSIKDKSFTFLISEIRYLGSKI